MAEPIPAPALWRLAAWTSAATPVGAFALSHGLETAIATGQVATAAALEAWVADLLAHGTGRTDAILAAHAWRGAEDPGALAELAELALALAPSAERRWETETLGAALARLVAADGIALASAPYPVTLGQAAARAGAPLAPTLLLGLQGLAGMLVSAAVRLVPLGQTEGHGVLLRLAPIAAAVAEEAADAPLDAVGSACFAWDIAAMAHETLEPRLFRT